MACGIDRDAVTGWKLINGGGRAEAEAVPVKPVEHGGPDSIENGTRRQAQGRRTPVRHRAVDVSQESFWRGLIGLSEQLDILISRQVNDRASVEAIVNRTGKALVPELSSMQPHPAFLGWHRRECFKH